MVAKSKKHITMPKDLEDRVNNLADTLGLSFSAVVTMALQAGIASITIATNPDLKPYFEAELKKVEKKNAQANRKSSAE